MERPLTIFLPPIHAADLPTLSEPQLDSETTDWFQRARERMTNRATYFRTAQIGKSRDDVAMQFSPEKSELSLIF